jgi:hypothetical protein
MASTNSTEQLNCAARVDQAATKAYELIQRYAEVSNPYDDETEDNPWRDPHAMFDAMKVARGELMSAWNELNATTTTITESNDSGNEKREGDFRAAYVDMVTDAFADVLENMRNNEAQEIDLDILVDCLQSGYDLLTMQDKDIFFRELEEGEAEDEDDTDNATPHERRRRELGFDVSVSS